MSYQKKNKIRVTYDAYGHQNLLKYFAENTRRTDLFQIIQIKEINLVVKMKYAFN